MKVPELGDKVPRTGNFFTQWLGQSVLQAMGWQIHGNFPNIAKFVLIVAPHTSNWDFVVAMAGKLAIRLSGSWLGKHTIFFWPLGVLLRRLGGVPVNRASTHGLVEQVAELFRARDTLVLGLSPEGTRKRVEKWRTGFYHIAVEAGVPIIPVYLDYGNKILGIGPMIVPTRNLDKDLEEIGKFFSRFEAKHPELFSPPRL